MLPACPGNPATEALLTHLRPGFWFSAHLHVKVSVSACVAHPPRTFPRQRPASLIHLCLSTQYPAVVHHDAQTAQSATHAPATRFLALDKCLPHRDFLQVRPKATKKRKGRLVAAVLWAQLTAFLARMPDSRGAKPRGGPSGRRAQGRV